MSFSRSKPYQAGDLGYVEGSNRSATAISISENPQVDPCFLSDQSASSALGEHFLSTFSREYRLCSVTATASRSSSKRSA